MMHVLSNISVKPTNCYLTTQLIPFFTDFVLLFMMVSAFSLCCGYYERMKTGTIKPNDFYKKRYSRILPYFALLCLLDILISPSLNSFYEIYANLTLCFGLLPYARISVIGVGWFLGVIFLFYLLFPFFVFMTDNKRRAWLSLGVSVAFAWIATIYSFNSELLVPKIGRNNIIYCSPLFLSGGLVYLYRQWLSRFVTKNSIVSLLATLAITLFFFMLPDVRKTNIGHLLAEVVLYTIWLIYAIGSKDKVLNNRVVCYLGKISMEIYLAHMVIFRAVERLHIENFITDADVLYWFTTILVLVGVVTFAHVVKFYILRRFN